MRPHQGERYTSKHELRDYQTNSLYIPHWSSKAKCDTHTHTPNIDQSVGNTETHSPNMILFEQEVDQK